MRKGIVLGAILLSACVTSPRMEDFEQECIDLAFPQFGGCLERAMDRMYPAWRRDPHGDLAEAYIAWIRAAGIRVAAGTMEEHDARYGAAVVKSNMKRVAAERDAYRAMSQQAAISQMLSGLALMNAAQEPASSPTIICTSSEAVRGYITTTCR